jgi:ATP-dependent Lon protease
MADKSALAQHRRRHPNPRKPISIKKFLAKAQAQLDADHFGLERIKRRLIEHLAVVKLKESANTASSRNNTAKGPIPLFVSPPPFPSRAMINRRAGS